MTDRLSKRGLFGALQRLDDSDGSEDGEDDSLEKLFVSSRPPRISNSTATRISARPRAVSLHRSNTEPQASPADRQGQAFSVTNIGNPRRMAEATEPKVRTVKRANTTGTMPATKTMGPPAKKRRTESIKLVPEDQQIFKGLVFCTLTVPSDGSPVFT